MSAPIPIYANEKTAAALLDMKPADFRRHVEAGDLPDGIEIVPGEKRWDYETLRSIGKGDAINGGIQW